MRRWCRRRHGWEGHGRADIDNDAMLGMMDALKAAHGRGQHLIQLANVQAKLRIQVHHHAMDLDERRRTEVFCRRQFVEFVIGHFDAFDKYSTFIYLFG